MSSWTEKSATARDDSNTIPALLQRGVLRNPLATALKFEDRTWTYQALAIAVNQVAGRLKALDLPTGS